jgi:hypothetical protein
MSLPPRLYKYENLTAQTLQNLKGQVLYFGSPLGFNDPYDCALTPNIRHPTDDEVETIRLTYLQNTTTPPLAHQEFEVISTNDLRQMLLRAGRSGLEKGINEFLATRGVTCFSQRNDDLLMWSHYGGQYKGICLEFSTASEPFAKIRSVQYVKTLPTIDLAPLLQGDFDLVSNLFCTKSESWSYEMEWRAIHAIAGTKYVYPAESLTGVYFGPEIDRESLEIICLILRGQNESVKFWRGTRSTTEFKVLFEEFTYTPHIEAKKNGLI